MASRRIHLAVCGSLMLPGILHAADGPAAATSVVEDRETEARTLVRRGLAAHARGEHEAALSDYERAAVLVPDANLPWLYRAEALRALGRVDDAIAAYEHYLSMDPTVVDAGSVRAKIEELNAKRRGKVVLETAPPGAVVRDAELGTVLGRTPLTLTFARGHHRLAVAREGSVTQYLELDVVAAETQRHSLALVAAQPVQARAPSSPCHGRRVAGVVAGSVGLATLVVGVVLDAAVAGAAKSDFEVARSTGANADAASASDRYQAAGLGAGTAYVVGGVLTAAGTAVALWPCPRRPSAPGAVGFRF